MSTSTRIVVGAIGVVLVVARPAMADRRARPLPKQCAADSPTDRPCTRLAGRYRLKLTPRTGTCVVTAPAEAELTVSGEGKTPALDAAPLVRALGLTPGPDDAPALSAAIRDGVCCLDLRLYGHAGDHAQRVTISLAAGQRLAKGKAADRWTQDAPGHAECGDGAIAVEATRVR